PPLQVSGVSTDGIIESTELKPEAGRLLPFFLTVQFNPERLVARHAEHKAIFRAFGRACGGNRLRYIYNGRVDGDEGRVCIAVEGKDGVCDMLDLQYGVDDGA